LEILDDSGLVRGRVVGARVVEGPWADGGVLRLENCVKVEHQPVPSCEFSTLWTRSGCSDALASTGCGVRLRERTDDKRKMTNVTAFTGHRILLVDMWIDFMQSDVETLSR
jgi:hypothetical protein